uniref:Uncharacterized protein n=1 Tax=Rhizophora mucronata TaxID=61149 RepID=A0A2P2QV34_RHIMU
MVASQRVNVPRSQVSFGLQAIPSKFSLA